MEKNTAVSQSYLFFITHQAFYVAFLKKRGTKEVLLFDQVIVARVLAHDACMYRQYVSSWLLAVFQILIKDLQMYQQSIDFQLEKQLCFNAVIYSISKSFCLRIVFGLNWQRNQNKFIYIKVNSLLHLSRVLSFRNDNFIDKVSVHHL